MRKRQMICSVLLMAIAASGCARGSRTAEPVTVNYESDAAEGNREVASGNMTGNGTEETPKESINETEPEVETNIGETTENETKTEEINPDRAQLYRTDESGNPAVGWITDEDGTIGYCAEDGYLMTGFQLLDGSRYLFTKDGDMCTGAYTSPEGERYCFTEDGRQYLNSVARWDDGSYYYFGEDGSVTTGTFTFPDGATGMTDENGRLYTGCHLIGTEVYNFTSEGKLRHTIDATKPMVALTYDDGPSTQNTQIILDTLVANGAYATFFVLGRNVERCADLIQNIENSGSEIGNHTYNHYMIQNMDYAVTNQEISSTSSYVQMITGNRPSIMRPPTGTTSEEACANVAAVDDGYPLILWSIDTADWKHKDAAVSCETIRTQVRDGSIILMHDMMACTADTSVIIIPELIVAGYQLVTVSEMAAARGGMVPGQIYQHFYPE